MKRIAIHSVPRSGSTWLGSIFDSCPNVLYKYQPLFSYALKGFLSPESSAEEIKTFFLKLEQINDNFIDQKEAKAKGIVPEFRKESFTTIVYKEVRYNNILKNLLLKDKEIKIIGLIRNPLAVLSSWYNARREFRKDLGWKLEEEWRFAAKKNRNKPEEFFGFEKWKQTAQLFEQLNIEYPERFYLVKYEDLLNKTEETVKYLFNFSNLNYTKQTEKFIKASKNKHNEDVYSVFKVKTEDKNWQNLLPRQIIEEINKNLKTSSMKKYITNFITI